MKIFISVVAILTHAVILGLCLSAMWGWFMVPLGLPEVTPVHAYGISCVVTMPFTSISLGVFGEKDTGEALAVTMTACVLYGIGTLVGALIVAFGWMQ